MPPELHDSYWWTPYGDAGQLGTTAQIGLPSDERILTVAEDLVVSASVTRAELETIFVRDFDTGELLRQIPSAVAWPSGALVDGHLFWTGLHGHDDYPQAFDGGVWSTDARYREAPMQIIAAGKELGGALCGRTLAVSPTQKTIAATASCFGWKGWTDLIDVESRTRTRRIQDANAWALTDGTYAVPEALPSDGLAFGQGGLTTHDIATDALRWRVPDLSNLDRYSLWNVTSIGNAFVVESAWDMGDHTEHRITLFQSMTGQHRLLLTDESGRLHLSQASSNASFIVLTEWDNPIDVDGTSISIIRVADGTLLRDAFVIDPPWICTHEWCFRD